MDNFLNHNLECLEESLKEQTNPCVNSSDLSVLTTHTESYI